MVLLTVVWVRSQTDKLLLLSPLKLIFSSIQQLSLLVSLDARQVRYLTQAFFSTHRSQELTWPPPSILSDDVTWRFLRLPPLNALPETVPDETPTVPADRGNPAKPGITPLWDPQADVSMGSASGLSCLDRFLFEAEPSLESEWRLYHVPRAASPRSTLYSVLINSDDGVFLTEIYQEKLGYICCLLEGIWTWWTWLPPVTTMT